MKKLKQQQKHRSHYCCKQQISQSDKQNTPGQEKNKYKWTFRIQKGQRSTTFLSPWGFMVKQTNKRKIIRKKEMKGERLKRHKKKKK